MRGGADDVLGRAGDLDDVPDAQSLHLRFPIQAVEDHDDVFLVFVGQGVDLQQFENGVALLDGDRVVIGLGKGEAGHHAAEQNKTQKKGEKALIHEKASFLSFFSYSILEKHSYVK